MAQAQNADIRKEFLPWFNGIEFGMPMSKVSSILKSKKNTLAPVSNDGLDVTYHASNKFKFQKHEYEVFLQSEKGILKCIIYGNLLDHEAASASVIAYLSDGRYDLYEVPDGDEGHIIFIDKSKKIIGFTKKGITDFSILFFELTDDLLEKFE